MSCSNRLRERSTARELDVVTMRGDGEKIESTKVSHAQNIRRHVESTCRPSHLRLMAQAPGVYSYLSASTGSSFDAFMAGSIPKITPVTALAPSDATIAIGGI